MKKGVAKEQVSLKLKDVKVFVGLPCFQDCVERKKMKSTYDGFAKKLKMNEMVGEVIALKDCRVMGYLI